MGSMGPVSASTGPILTLQRVLLAGERRRPPKSQIVGGPLRTRRLRVGPPTAMHPTKESA